MNGFDFSQQPDFSKTPLVTESDIFNWLKFYEMDAPLIHVGEIVSADPEVTTLEQFRNGSLKHVGLFKQWWNKSQ